MKNEVNEPCRICSRSSFRPWGEHGNNKLYQCINCEVVFFYPYPTTEELENYYNKQYHVDRGYDGSGRAGELRKKMYSLDIDDLEETLPNGGKILDVGCAEGVFLSFLDEKWQKVGIDCSTQAIERAREKPGIQAMVADIEEMDDNFFDVIHLRGVFEHLLDPLEFMHHAYRKLRKGGSLVLSNTPNAGGIVPRLFRGRFRLVIPKEHLHYFTIKSIHEMATRTNFKVKSLRYPYFGTPYCNFLKDLVSIPFNYISGKSSPPFYGNIFTAYLQKEIT